MMKLTAVWLLVVLLLPPLNSAQGVITYVLDGGKLDLTPPYDGKIDNVLWKHTTNLVAEWVQGDVVVYYGVFKGRTQLDVNTGRLEITNMMKADSGLYTVEINSKVQEKAYNVTLTKEVPQPTVWIRPLTCTAASENCTLICDGDVSESEPVTYSWREGEGQWKQSTKDMNIIKGVVSHIQTFSCRITNPVSRKESEPKDNLFFVKTGKLDSNVGGTVAGVIVGLLLLVLAGLGIWKREQIKNLVCQRSGGNNNDAQPSPDQPDTPTIEEVPLKKDGDPDGVEKPPV